MFLIPPFALRAGARLYWFCQRWMPSNILVRRVRTRDGARWGIPLALLGLVYLAFGIVCAMLAQHGDGGAWYLGFLYGFGNALKLVGNGLYATTVLLPIARVREARDRNAVRISAAVHSDRS